MDAADAVSNPIGILQMYVQLGAIMTAPYVSNPIGILQILPGLSTRSSSGVSNPIGILQISIPHGIPHPPEWFQIP